MTSHYDVMYCGLVYFLVAPTKKMKAQRSAQTQATATATATSTSTATSSATTATTKMASTVMSKKPKKAALSSPSSAQPSSSSSAQPKSSSSKNATSDPTVPPFPLHRGKSAKRTKFSDAFQSLAKLLEGRKKILVLAGAGMSVSCGIPDFRTKDKGLYATLDFQELGLSCPEDLFDLEIFREDPRPFYKFAKELYFPLGKDKRVEPSDSHKFLAMLEKKKQLLRVYTQNIDGLEEIAGVSPRRMVYAHGSLQVATCTRCKRKVKASAIESAIMAGSVARCDAPLKSSSSSSSSKPRSNSVEITPSSSPRIKRRRCSSEEEERQPTASAGICGGVMKPGVTFFGEILGDKVRRTLEADRDKADAMIVIGTSLSVAPMSKIIDFLPRKIPRILINRTVVHPPRCALDDDEDDDDEDDVEFRENYIFDAYMLGFCDDVTRALVKEMKDKTNHESSDTNDKQKKKKNSKNNNGTTDIPTEGKLLAALTKRDKVFTTEDWSNVRIPGERVFLFPGAISPDDDSSELTYREVAHCDGCAKEIKVKVHKCIQCFDYDLCRMCYPKLSKDHFDGKHKFAAEQIERRK